MINGKSQTGSRLKVSIIEPVGGHSGMDYYDFGLCSGLQQAGIEPTLYTCDETIVDPRYTFRVIPAYKNIFGAKAKWLRGIKYIAATLYALLQSRLAGTRICHFHFFQTGIRECVKIILAKIFRMQIVITAHDVESFATTVSIPAITRICYKPADRIIAHNRWTRDELVRCLGINQSKIAIIPHGNYIDFIGRLPGKTEARDKLNIAHDRKVILFFGRIKQVKGLDLLLTALPDVIKSHPDVMLLIAGRVWKDDYSTYSRIIEQNHLQPYCREDIRYIPNSKVGLYYDAADLVVLPYRRIYQSGVLLMAMSYGKAVLASDLEGMREIVQDNESGFLFQCGNVKSLTDSLVRILADKKMSEHVAVNGKKHVKKEFHWQRIGRLTAECYSEL